MSFEPPIKNFTETVNGVSFDMVAVKGGTFSMGSESGSDNEKPIHSVTLSEFSIGKTEVTQTLWQAVMGNNPSYFKGDNLPVESVSWNDCQAFITKLNQLTGKNYRLPTESEWEYAARGGNQSKGYKYVGSDNIDEVAEYEGNHNKTTKPVGGKKPNELGLYDMSGNVWEWCNDWYGTFSSSAQTNPIGVPSGSLRVFRGGSLSNGAFYCRSAYRSTYYPSYSGYNLGLRLVFSR
ncbi:MAG: formylglycine-generating enzyme family protein [Paludibacter sp.]